VSAERGRQPSSRGAIWRRALPALLWAVLIFAFSSQADLPRVPVSVLDLIAKKAAHLAEYAVLAILILRALVPARSKAGRGALLTAWALAVLYAVTDEIHQSFVPGRTAAALDVLIDGLGAMLGLAGLAAAQRLREPTLMQPTPPYMARRR
jgi:VanZ family protein